MKLRLEIRFNDKVRIRIIANYLKKLYDLSEYDFIGSTSVESVFTFKSEHQNGYKTFTININSFEERNDIIRKTFTININSFEERNDIIRKTIIEEENLEDWKLTSEYPSLGEYTFERRRKLRRLETNFGIPFIRRIYI